jgi:toxin YoeB
VWLLVSLRVVYTKQAQRDAKGLAAAGLAPKARDIIAIIAEDPFRSPPPYEKLMGHLTGAFSRRINIHNRIVYQVLEQDGVVKVLRMWTHYE